MGTDQGDQGDEKAGAEDEGEGAEGEAEEDFSRAPETWRAGRRWGIGDQSVTPRAAATVCMSLSPRPLSPMRRSWSERMMRATCIA